jgi:Fur family transcriptional regulator, ferric uptake regulator
MTGKNTSAASRIQEADTLIRQSGARLTASRSAVLSLLLKADHALTHQEITDALTDTLPVDRVTIYRVLEWLVEQGLAHRIAQDDRVWRFSASKHSASRHDHQHAHFSCRQCGQTFCLDDVPARVTVKLPPGYQSDEVELTIRGTCEHCGEHCR